MRPGHIPAGPCTLRVLGNIVIGLAASVCRLLLLLLLLLLLSPSIESGGLNAAHDKIVYMSASSSIHDGFIVAGTARGGGRRLFYVGVFGRVVEDIQHGWKSYVVVIEYYW